MGQTPERPQFPANLVGDFGGGSTYLVIGLLAALLEARVSGQGQVVDAAIVDGTAHLNAMTSAFLASGGYQERRGANLLDGGVPFYDVYETSDGRHVSVGALEPQFYATLIRTARPRGHRARAGRPGPLRRAPHPAHRHLRAADPGRVGRAVRGHRRLRRRRDPGQRGTRPPAPQGPARPSSSARGWCSRSRRRASPAPQPRSRCRPPPAAGTHTREALTAWGIARRRRAHRARRRRTGLSTVKPFLFLGIRAQDTAADDEYAAVLRCTGLDERDVRRVRLERDELAALDLDDWSGIVLGGGPWNISDPDALKDDAAAAGRGPAAGARAAGRRGRLPVPRRLLRHRHARHPGRRRGRPAVPRADRADDDLPDRGRPGRPAVRRLPETFDGPARPQGGGVPPAATARSCWRRRRPARCRRSGSAPHVYATQFHPELDMAGVIAAHRGLPGLRLLRAARGRRRDRPVAGGRRSPSPPGSWPASSSSTPRSDPPGQYGRVDVGGDADPPGQYGRVTCRDCRR